MEHSFTVIIKAILESHFAGDSNVIFDQSQLIQYINLKTRSANQGSKSRASFASLYAIYVLVEDYLKMEFHQKGGYSQYDGAEFHNLFRRQRELAFGSKLQNHALNNRVNSEFQKFFPNSEYIPISRNLETNRYWINENLLNTYVNGEAVNLAEVIVEIIDEYIKTKQDAFIRFIRACKDLQHIEKESQAKAERFIFDLLAPNVDARLFEIVSFAILKYYYHDQLIYWGFEKENLSSDNLKLYKTGRTNANDGGIDFVMKPLGRFFQVTESLDFRKYFLDIDKIQKYPVSFVIKSEESEDTLSAKIAMNASKTYAVKAVVDKYMACIEEIINLPKLRERFLKAAELGYVGNILDEIVLQSNVEFNYQELND